MTTIDLFADPPPAPKKRRAHARRTDPDTSHGAARAIEPKLTRLEQRLLAAFRERGPAGFTSWELAEVTGIDRVTVSPRLKPMAQAGVLIATPDRRVGPSGRPSVVWRAK